MGQFLRDRKLQNLTIDDSALEALDQVFVARAGVRNAAVASSGPEVVYPYYIVRFDGKGYRFNSAAEAKKQFDDAKSVERIAFVMESGADRQSAGLFGTKFELRLDARDSNNSWLSVTSDDRQWTEETFAAVSDVLATRHNTKSRIARSQWSTAIVQALGVALGFFFSAWAASVIAPNLALENPFAVSLIFALLIFSNIWGYLLVLIAGGINFLFPNVAFIRKDKEGKGNWFLRAGLVSVIVAPLSYWILSSLFALAARYLNYIVK